MTDRGPLTPARFEERSIAGRARVAADLQAAVGLAPNTPLEDGVGRYVDWYRGCIA